MEYSGKRGLGFASIEEDCFRGEEEHRQFLVEV